MTGSDITGAIIVCIIAFLIIFLIWWMLKEDMGFDDIANYMEDPEEL